MEIETTAMARRRLLMNYEWFPELLLQLPDSVKENYYCKKLLLHLAELADYMCNIGPWKMSKKKLSQVLATCRPWELHNPDISSAIQVYIKDYDRLLLNSSVACRLLTLILCASLSTVPYPARDLHCGGGL